MSGIGLVIPDEANASSTAMSAWIDSNRDTKRHRRGRPPISLLVHLRLNRRGRQRGLGNEFVGGASLRRSITSASGHRLARQQVDKAGLGHSLRSGATPNARLAVHHANAEPTRSPSALWARCRPRLPLSAHLPEEFLAAFLKRGLILGPEAARRRAGLAATSF